MSVKTSSFHFPIGKNVNRDVTIVAPHQGGHPVKIKALRLPLSKPGTKVTHTKPGPKRGQEKGNDFYIWIIRPEVSDAVTGKVITRFNPALKISVVYLSEDEEKAEGKLSLCVSWRKKGTTWNYKILLTRADKVKKTLTATIDNLFPDDPIGAGIP